MTVVNKSINAHSFPKKLRICYSDSNMSDHGPQAHIALVFTEWHILPWEYLYS